jgi:hypothetical protein
MPLGLAIVFIIVAFLVGGVCGYQIRRNSPQTSSKIDNTYSQAKAEADKLKDKIGK